MASMVGWMVVDIREECEIIIHCLGLALHAALYLGAHVRNQLGGQGPYPTLLTRVHIPKYKLLVKGSQVDMRHGGFWGLFLQNKKYFSSSFQLILNIV